MIISGFVFNIMKKSIPLKEIVGFLPYGLKFKTPIGNLILNEINNNSRYKLWFNFGYKSRNKFEEYNYKNVAPVNFVGKGYYINSVKPIVRPLSDLTKEITHNGETFVPEEFLNNNSKDFYIPDDWNAVLFIENENILSVNYAVIQKLYEWHFDIYDWIKDGLAVDINTI